MIARGCPGRAAGDNPTLEPETANLINLGVPLFLRDGNQGAGAKAHDVAGRCFFARTSRMIAARAADALAVDNNK
jgi:hypothetical protein